MIIAVDFDGTIVEHKYPLVGELKAGRPAVLWALKKAGHTIIIWTCRHSEKDLKDVRDFLSAQLIPYDKINENADGISFNPYPKIYADIYIDDRNIFSTSNVYYRSTLDWEDIKIRLLNIGVIK